MCESKSWYIAREVLDELGHTRVTIRTASGELVARLYGYDSESNAQLILAAPKLLDTLKHARSIIVAGSEGGPVEYGPELMIIDAAINEAEGIRT